jgi:hypothetical protein
MYMTTISQRRASSWTKESDTHEVHWDGSRNHTMGPQQKEAMPS